MAVERNGAEIDDPTGRVWRNKSAPAGMTLLSGSEVFFCKHAPGGGFQVDFKTGCAFSVPKRVGRPGLWLAGSWPMPASLARLRPLPAGFGAAVFASRSQTRKREARAQGRRSGMASFAGSTEGNFRTAKVGGAGRN